MRRAAKDELGVSWQTLEMQGQEQLRLPLGRATGSKVPTTPGRRQNRQGDIFMCQNPVTR